MRSFAPGPLFDFSGSGMSRLCSWYTTRVIMTCAAVHRGQVCAKAMKRATQICISGLASGVGKTTVLCDLLRFYPGWEAIKVSRGHYRSCGKDPQACCISPMLGEKPLILSGRADTFAPGKDTGRYWDAGAANVHWVVCASDQVEEGIRIALSMVKAEGVFIESTSILKYIPADYSIMVTGPSIMQIKSSAARVMDKMNAVFVTRSEPDPGILSRLQTKVTERGYSLGPVPIYFDRDMARMAEEVGRFHRTRLSAGP